MSKKTNQWGKFKGEKPICLIIEERGEMIGEGFDTISIKGVISTSAAERLLKAETGKTYDIVRVDYNGEFSTEPYKAKKVEAYLSKLLYNREIQFDNV